MHIYIDSHALSGLIRTKLKDSVFTVTHYMINKKLYHKARDRAVKAESFHLAIFGLKKSKTKGSDGQPSMYIYFDYITLLACISPTGRAEKAAEIQDNSFVSRFFFCHGMN